MEERESAGESLRAFRDSRVSVAMVVRRERAGSVVGLNSTVNVGCLALRGGGHRALLRCGIKDS